MSRDTCADCVHMDFNNRNSMNDNQFYCRKREHYYDSDDTACRDFIARVELLKPQTDVLKYKKKPQIEVKEIAVT